MPCSDFRIVPEYDSTKCLTVLIASQLLSFANNLNPGRYIDTHTHPTLVNLFLVILSLSSLTLSSPQPLSADPLIGRFPPQFYLGPFFNSSDLLPHFAPLYSSQLHPCSLNYLLTNLIY
jgi:hypothetical protein